MVTIRHAEKSDAAAIRDIYACSSVYAGTLQLPFPSLQTWEQRLDSQPAHHYSLVAEVNGVIAGQIGIWGNSNPRRRHVVGIGIGVRENYQGQGIGNQLLEAAIDLAENWLGATRIELSVYTDNTVAIAFYEKWGFYIEGTAKNYAFRDGSYVDVHNLARTK